MTLWPPSHHALHKGQKMREMKTMIRSRESMEEEAMRGMGNRGRGKGYRYCHLNVACERR